MNEMFLPRAPILAVAPMMAWTDRHCRAFHRMISRHARLYTEMVPAGAIVHGEVERFLAFDPSEHPLALQVGGSEPSEMAIVAREAQRFGYDEINVNVGCPSSRVQSGRFGACLMAEPDRVARIVEAIRRATPLRVTVKTRTGIDDLDRYEDLAEFVRIVAGAGCETFIVHARKAWLTGLSPKENRDVPPLRYDRVRRLKANRPELTVVLNGGITSLDDAAALLEPEDGIRLDGVMIGRAAYRNPYLLSRVDRLFFGAAADPSREEVLSRIAAYAAGQLAVGVPLKRVTRHVLGLYQGRPGARAWRRLLTEGAMRPGVGVELLEEAAAFVRGPVPTKGAERASEQTLGRRFRRRDHGFAGVGGAGQAGDVHDRR